MLEGRGGGNKVCTTTHGEVTLKGLLAAGAKSHVVHDLQSPGAVTPVERESVSTSDMSYWPPHLHQGHASKRT